MYNSSQDIRCSLSPLRLEIRNAELTESRRSKSARSETVSNEEPLEEDKGEEKEVVEEEEVEVVEKEEDEDEKRRGRLSIALTNCGDVLERQLFDAIFWLVDFFWLLFRKGLQEEAKHRLSLPCLSRLCARRKRQGTGGGRWVRKLPKIELAELSQDSLTCKVDSLKLSQSWSLVPHGFSQPR